MCAYKIMFLEIDSNKSRKSVVSRKDISPLRLCSRLSAARFIWTLSLKHRHLRDNLWWFAPDTPSPDTPSPDTPSPDVLLTPVKIAPALAIYGLDGWKATSKILSSNFFLWAVISCTHVLLSRFQSLRGGSWWWSGWSESEKRITLLTWYCSHDCQISGRAHAGPPPGWSQSQGGPPCCKAIVSKFGPRRHLGRIFKLISKVT